MELNAQTTDCFNAEINIKTTILAYDTQFRYGCLSKETYEVEDSKKHDLRPLSLSMAEAATVKCLRYGFYSGRFYPGVKKVHEKSSRASAEMMEFLRRDDRRHAMTRSGTRRPDAVWHTLA